MRTIILIKLLLITSFCFAQIPVTDAATNANIGVLNSQVGISNTNLAELIAIQTAAKGEAVETTLNTTETVTQAKKIYDLYEKINSAISDAKVVIEIYEEAEELINKTYRLAKIFQSTKKLNKKTKNQFINQASDIMNGIQPIMNLVNKLLTKDVLKAKDGSRLQLLLKARDEIKEENQKIDVLEHNTVYLFKLVEKRVKD